MNLSNTKAEIAPERRSKTMATTHRTIVVGIFDRLRLAQQATEELRAAGFAENEVGIVARNMEVTQLPAEHTEHEDKAEQGLLRGLLAGAGAGGLWAAGMAVELLPGIGEVLVGGVMATIAAGAVVGATAGGMLGSLLWAGLPEDEAERFAQEIRAGKIIVTVHTDDRYDEACRLLRENGALINTDSVTSLHA
jgi:hypothetical protein